MAGVKVLEGSTAGPVLWWKGLGVSSAVSFLSLCRPLFTVSRDALCILIFSYVHVEILAIFSALMIVFLVFSCVCVTSRTVSCAHRGAAQHGGGVLSIRFLLLP